MVVPQVTEDDSSRLALTDGGSPRFASIRVRLGVDPWVPASPLPPRGAAVGAAHATVKMVRESSSARTPRFIRSSIVLVVLTLHSRSPRLGGRHARSAAGGRLPLLEEYPADRRALQRGGRRGRRV